MQAGSQITAVSNSKTQASHIRAQARKRGITSLQAVTADVVTYQAPKRHFDRVVSVEMFEHMKNYKVRSLPQNHAGCLKFGAGADNVPS